MLADTLLIIEMYKNIKFKKKYITDINIIIRDYSMDIFFRNL